MRPRSPLSSALSPALALAIVTLTAGGCRNRTTVEPTPPPPVEEPQPSGRDLVHPAAPVSLHLPEGWRDEVEEASLTLLAPGDAVVMIIVAIEAADLEASLEQLNRELGTIVRDAEIAEITEVEVGGMAAMVADGHGSLESQAVELGLMLLRAPNGRILMVVGVALEDTSAEIKEESSMILASFRPVD